MTDQITSPDTPDPLGWSDVDASPDPASYARYLSRVGESAAMRRFRAATAELLGLYEGCRYLDVGCGTGLSLPDFQARVGGTGAVVGVDNSLVILREAAKIRKNRIEIFGASAYSLPFASGVFDAVQAERVLMHLERPGDAVKEMVRVMRHSSAILLSDPDSEIIGIAGPELDLVRTIVDRRRHLIRSPNAGRLHTMWLRRAGIRDIELLPGVTAYRSLEQAEMHTQLVEGAKLLGRAGLIAVSVAEEFVRQLRASSDAEELVVFTCYFRTLGRRDGRMRL